MAKYKVMLTTVADFTIGVDADDEEQAVEAAYDKAPAEVCGHCSGWGEAWSLTLNDAWQLHEPEVEKQPERMTTP